MTKPLFDPLDEHFRQRFSDRCGKFTLSNPIMAWCRFAFQVLVAFDQRRGYKTLDLLQSLGLNERQFTAIAFLKANDSIGNTEYQSVAATTKKTATRDLDELVTKRLLEKVGTTGRGVH